MTSSRFFFKFQKEMLQRYLVLLLLSGIGFFLCLPLAVIIAIQSSSGSRELLVYLGLQVLAGNVFVNLGIVGMATFAGILIFGYLHHRKQVDFFHSLPIERTKLFGQLYLTGILAVLPLYLVMHLLAATIVRFVGTVPDFNFFTLLMGILNNIAFFLLFYSMAVLACVITGNRFIALVMCGIFHVILPGTAALLNTLCSRWFSTYAGIRWLEDFISNTFPLEQYFSVSAVAVGQYTNIYVLQNAIGVLIASVVLTGCAALLYKMRKSEMASSALAFEWMKAPIKCYLVVISGYTFMQILLLFGNSGWTYPGIVLGVVLSHLVLEAVFHFDVRSIFSHWKTMLVLTALCFGFYAVMDADIIGYDKKVPLQEQVESVSVSSYYKGTNKSSNENYINLGSENITEPENTNTILKMAQYAVDNLEIPDATETVHLNVTYQLTNGNEMRRNYTVPATQEYNELLDTLRFTEEYLKKKQQSPNSIDLQNEESIEILVTDYTQTNYAKINDTKTAKEIFAALQQESLEWTKQQAETELPVLYLELNYGLDPETIESSKTYYFHEQYPIYAGYTQTLALLKQYAGIEPYAYTAQDIREIQITYYPQEDFAEDIPMTEQADAVYWDNAVIITDQPTIEKLLEGAILRTVATDADPLFPVENDGSIQIYVTFKNGFNDGLLYKSGSGTEEYAKQLWQRSVK